MKALTSKIFKLSIFLLLVTTTAHAGLKEYFVDTEWLSKNIESVKVVDVRVSPLYYLGHIDGALNIDKSEFLVTRKGVKSLIPSAEELSALLDKYGITPDTTVVAYAEDDNPYSSRFVWTLRYHGHEKAYVLDGGFDKWANEKRGSAILKTSHKSSSGYKVTNGENIRAEAGYLLSRLGNPSTVVWDTRRDTEYLGTEVRAERGGHIPGVQHLNWTELQKEVDGVKVLKSEEELLSLLASKGITPDKEIVAHCQTGIRSSYATLVLLGLGYPDVRNYDGSWIEWANDGSYPIENPALTLSN
ncbi:MAG: hypothetical protein C0608_01695 [Deltaproteobacteria bacterium]|nr:MAG: hypothetical protein C0608_01695 [Deltaproteobacteria bacterium]